MPSLLKLFVVFRLLKILLHISLNEPCFRIYSFEKKYLSIESTHIRYQKNFLSSSKIKKFNLIFLPRSKNPKKDINLLQKQEFTLKEANIFSQDFLQISLQITKLNVKNIRSIANLTNEKVLVACENQIYEEKKKNLILRELA